MNAATKTHTMTMTSVAREDREGGRASTAAPRWARRVAVLTVLTTVPSGLWRSAMALGAPLGVDSAYWSDHFGFTGQKTAYVFGLTVLLLVLSALTLGLVRPWGEVLPRWVPLLGGRHVPRLAAMTAAGAGALAVTMLWITAFANLEAIFIEYGLEGAARLVVVGCYAPLLLWGPLLAAVTVSYARRTKPVR